MFIIIKLNKFQWTVLTHYVVDMGTVYLAHVSAAKAGRATPVTWWMMKNEDVFLTVVDMGFGTLKWPSVFVIKDTGESPAV